MAIYIGIEILLLIAVYAKRNREVWYYFLLSLLTFVSAFRADTVGGDMFYYIPTYEEYHIETWREVIKDPNYSFAIYCKILNCIGLDIRGFMIANAVVFAILLTVAFHVNKCDKLLALTIFYTLGLYIQSFCIIRQSFANVVFMIAYAYIDKGQIHLVIPIKRREGKPSIQKHSVKVSLRFLILMIIAIGFHTATVFLLVIPLFLWIYPRKQKIRPITFLKVGWGFLFIALVCFRFFYSVVLNYLPSKYAYLYSGFSQSLFGNAKNAVLLLMLYMLFFICYQNHFEKIDTSENLRIGSTITLSITLISMSMIQRTLGRMNLFTECLMAMMVTNLIQNSYRDRKSSDSVFVWIYAGYFILYLFRDSIGVVPYVFGI